MLKQYQTIQGPTDSDLRHTELEGYHPVSRIGEIVLNCFVDGYEFARLPAHLTRKEMIGSLKGPGQTVNMTTAEGDAPVEYRPPFHEWASATPGMIMLTRKARNATFRNYVAAETATPVVGCCACLKQAEERDFYFAGICRSKTVRSIDDGAGPNTDEFFTIAIGGMVTLLNNGTEAVYPGDILEWSFFNEDGALASTTSTDNRITAKRHRSNPRRIAVRVASPTSDKIIGRCLSFAKCGETFDLLLKQC